MAQPITKVLEKINEDPKNLQQFRGQVNAIQMIMEYAYMKEKKFELPDGAPPFKPAAEPLGMTPINLYAEMRRFYVFCRKDLKQIQREQMFVGLLEGIHGDEVALMLAVKDQKLNKLYPKLTKKWAEDNGFIPKPEPKVAKKDAVKAK